MSKTGNIKESSIHFGLLGNGITAYDVSHTDSKTHDYPIVAHISEEGNLHLYTNNISPEDMERINKEAQSQREKFLHDWETLTPEEQYYHLLDRSDITTMRNICREKLLTMEDTIKKYMPFVFFEEGDRPEPERKV